MNYTLKEKKEELQERIRILEWNIRGQANKLKSNKEVLSGLKNEYDKLCSDDQLDMFEVVYND